MCLRTRPAPLEIHTYRRLDAHDVRHDRAGSFGLVGRFISERDLGGCCHVPVRALKTSPARIGDRLICAVAAYEGSEGFPDDGHVESKGPFIDVAKVEVFGFVPG